MPEPGLQRVAQAVALPKFVELPFTIRQGHPQRDQVGRPERAQRGRTARRVHPAAEIGRGRGLQRDQLHPLRVLPSSRSTWATRSWALSSASSTSARRSSTWWTRRVGSARSWTVTRCPPTGRSRWRPPTASPTLEELHDPYLFSVSDAASILKAHGWADVAPGKTAYCAKPGTRCGRVRGRRAPGPEARLQPRLPERRGDHRTKRCRTSSPKPAQVGIDLELTEHPFAQVVGTRSSTAAPAARPSRARRSATGRLSDWGAGWVYAPDFEPTGESHLLHRVGCRLRGLQQCRSRPPDRGHHDGPGQPVPRPPSTPTRTTWSSRLPVVFFPTATGDPTAASIVLTSKHLGGYINNAVHQPDPRDLVPDQVSRQRARAGNSRMRRSS